MLDDELVVVKIVDVNGDPIAALFNFAVHGTSLSSSNMQLSADCMGAMEARVEAKIPGATAIFTNGAEGDVAPKHTRRPAWTLEGQIVGAAVSGLWPSIGTKPTAMLGGAFLDVVMPAPRYNPFGCIKLFGSTKTLCSALGLQLVFPFSPNWVSATLPFQAIRIDDAVFVAIPGEPVTDIGRQIKQKAKARGFTRPIVLGLANDHGGYFSTVEQYELPTYEGTVNIYGKGSGQLVVDKADAVMGLLP